MYYISKDKEYQFIQNNILLLYLLTSTFSSSARNFFNSKALVLFVETAPGPLTQPPSQPITSIKLLRTVWIGPEFLRNNFV